MIKHLKWKRQAYSNNYFQHMGFCEKDKKLTVKDQVLCFVVNIIFELNLTFGIIFEF